MIKYFLLAILVGIVLRFIATKGLFHCLRTSATEIEMKSKPIFHFYIITYVVATILRYGGTALTFAFLVSKYLL